MKKQMEKNSNIEKWDYVVSGKPYGIMRIVIIGILAVFFAVLTIDQLKLTPNKMLIVAIFFGGICVTLTVTLIRLINRFFYYSVYIGKTGFFFRTNPFNGKYYRYADIKHCGEELVKSRRNAGTTDKTTYNYFFFFTDCKGNTKKILFEKALYEKEFDVLTRRINSVG